MELKAIRYERRRDRDRHHHARPAPPPQRVDRPHAHRVPLGARAGRGRSRACGSSSSPAPVAGFCAGADSGALEGHVDKGGYDPGTPDDIANPGYGVRPEFDHDFAFHFGLTKPVIAAINGPAAGVGLVLACYCDLRFAAAGAKLTTAHGKLHLPAEYGLSWLLPRLIGLTRANDLLLSSRTFLAEEAATMGLVNAVVARRRPARRTPTTTPTMLATTVSPGSLAETKRQIYTDLHRDVGSVGRGGRASCCAA